MKNRLLYLLTFLIINLILVSCREKEDTTPSLADKDRMEMLIDNDIKDIVEFKAQNGTYILYNFDKALDFAYQFEQASNWTKAQLTTIGHDDAKEAVKLLKDKLFVCYDETFIKQYFPRKLLIVDDIVSTTELGLSTPASGHHLAVANINSVTLSQLSATHVAEALDNEVILAKRINAYHRALLADYLVNARGKYPVGDDYFAFSKSYYSSLMNSSRKNASQLLKENPAFFAERGFFNPDDGESTYFSSVEEDVVEYIKHAISMDKDEADELFDKPMMASKMNLLCTGLKKMGVDIVSINPNMEQFITMEQVIPATMYTNDVVTDNPTATLQVTILRGSKALARLDISVNGVAQSSVDLSAYDKIRNVITVQLNDLVKGINNVTLTLYEEGREKPSLTHETAVSYATMDQVTGFSITCNDDPADVYRDIRIYEGDGGMVDDEENPNLTTIAFRKHGWLDKYFMEQESEYRYWKMYKETIGGAPHIVNIIEYLQDGFNEDYTAPLYRITAEYTFKYNDAGELTELFLTDENGKQWTLVQDVVYVNGRMTRYTYDGRIYDPQYATVDGITTRVDCLDSNMSGRTFGFDGTEDLNPYYMPELPAVIPGFVAEIPLQLFYSQYLFDKFEGVWPDGWVHDLDQKVNYLKVDINDTTWKFRFKLK